MTSQQAASPPEPASSTQHWQTGPPRSWMRTDWTLAAWFSAVRRCCVTRPWATRHLPTMPSSVRHLARRLRGGTPSETWHGHSPHRWKEAARRAVAAAGVVLIWVGGLGSGGAGFCTTSTAAAAAAVAVAEAPAAAPAPTPDPVPRPGATRENISSSESLSNRPLAGAFTTCGLAAVTAGAETGTAFFFAAVAAAAVFAASLTRAAASNMSSSSLLENRLADGLVRAAAPPRSGAAAAFWSGAWAGAGPDAGFGAGAGAGAEAAAGVFFVGRWPAGAAAVRPPNKSSSSSDKGSVERSALIGRE